LDSPKPDIPNVSKGPFWLVGLVLRARPSSQVGAKGLWSLDLQDQKIRPIFKYLAVAILVV
jgi:hypothetical protein